jgi:hypothetical protein|tara:strand:+ start:30 stop:713 length:684 start_codon:yes stop_codon:yes gene_type:complete
MGKVHEIFPLIVYQGNVDGHDEFKKNLEDIKKYWFNGYKYESPEGSERIFLHRNEKYIDFFSIHIRKVFDEYFDALNIDYNKLSYHICKSWVVYHKDDTTPPMAPHSHNEANISFVYYLNTDETSDKFVVTQHPDNNVNQVCQGFFDVADELNIMTGFNRYNCNMYTITPKEGTCIVMPSETYHQTIKKQPRLNERVAIAGDVRVTMKPEYFRYHQGCTHPSQWLEI